MPKVTEQMIEARTKTREEVRTYLQARRDIQKRPKFVIRNSRPSGEAAEYYQRTDFVSMVGVHIWAPLDQARTFTSIEDASRVKRGFRNVKHRLYGNIVPIEKERAENVHVD